MVASDRRSLHVSSPIKVAKRSRSSVGQRAALAASQQLIDENDHQLSVDVPRDQIDLVVAQIKRIVRMAGLEFSLNVGHLIIHHFYKGDPDAWRSRGPKAASFRRLARHPELPLSAGALYRCVALYELCDRLNAPSRWPYLGASHLRLVIGLRVDAQEKLLATANANRWSVKVLQQAARQETSSRIARGGRRPQPALTKNLLSAGRYLAYCMDHVNHVSSNNLEQSLQLVEEAKVRLERLSQSLQAALIKETADPPEHALIRKAVG